MKRATNSKWLEIDWQHRWRHFCQATIATEIAMPDLLAMLPTMAIPFRHNDLVDLNLYLEMRNITNGDEIYLKFLYWKTIKFIRTRVYRTQTGVRPTGTGIFYLAWKTVEYDELIYLRYLKNLLQLVSLTSFSFWSSLVRLHLHHPKHFDLVANQLLLRDQQNHLSLLSLYHALKNSFGNTSKK